MTTHPIPFILLAATGVSVVIANLNPPWMATLRGRVIHGAMILLLAVVTLAVTLAVYPVF